MLSQRRHSLFFMTPKWSERKSGELSETWNAFYSSVREISVRKMTVDKGSASRGMIVMCGEKQIGAEGRTSSCTREETFWGRRSGLKNQSRNRGQSSGRRLLFTVGINVTRSRRGNKSSQRFTSNFSVCLHQLNDQRRSGWRSREP